MEREDLSDLKQGDEVAMRYGYNSRYMFATIEKVTPSGLIKVRGDYYTPDGRQRGGGYSAPHITRATQKIKDEMTRQGLAYKLEKALEAEPLKHRSLETLRAVAAALGVAE